MTQKYKKYLLVIAFLNVIHHTFNFAKDVDIIVQKLKEINYSQEQIHQISNKAIIFSDNNIPYVILTNLVNEVLLKKIPFEKFYPIFNSTIEKSLLTKELIHQVSTKNFFPKDYEYCFTLTIKIINSGITEEEYVKLMSFLSNHYSFDDALSMLNYYYIFKKYFKDVTIENKKITLPYNVLFLRYSNRTIKDMNQITNAIIRYFSNTNTTDANDIYTLLNENYTLPTNLLVKKLQLLHNEKVKQEIKQEIEHTNRSGF
ncbi:MAG: hypothetical protein N2643_04885 [Endomicrobia bacterium]|nr:hypothetical protein [Endomicrobiia bacterium]